MHSDFKDRIALVTGGGSGIGRAISLTFAECGAKVVIGDLSAEGGNSVVHEIKSSGGEALFHPCDVSRSEEVKALVRRTVEYYGKLDFAVNNAGIPGSHNELAEYPEDIWNKVLSVNLTGIFLCMKFEIPRMLDQNGGAIVNVASVAGFAAQRGTCPYIASKHGVIGLTKTAALEYARKGIRVNAICPGITSTPLIDKARSEVPKDIKRVFSGETIPMGRIADPEEIAEAAVWLCSKAASYVTGHSLVIDGGMIAE